MRANLAKLLRERPVGHPSRIVAATLKNQELRVRVAGWPWWSDHADRGRDQEIEFIFGSVSGGILEPQDFDSDYDEALESFSIIGTDDLSWAQPHGSAIYCNAPLPKPLDVYRKVHDFLASNGAFRRAWQYLNCAGGEQLTPFVEITQARSYLLGRFPPAIRDVVCAELDLQKVAYSELPTMFEKPGPLLVTIEMSQFFCETAEAEFES